MTAHARSPAPRGVPAALRGHRGWLLGALAGWLTLRVLAVFTVAVNWDEFGLLALADRSLESGRLHAGGRPGLAVLVLLPFAAGCENEIAVIRGARLLWLGVSLAYLAGVGVLLARLQPDPRRRLRDALAGVALLAGVPAFLEWSVQVRTDQLALAAGVWGAVALLASRRRPLLALAAGALFGVGFLATQKLVYVAALGGLLATGDVLAARALRWRRELVRGALCAGAAGAVVLAFYAGLRAFAEGGGAGGGAPTPGQIVSHGFSVFEFYRHTIGWSQYRELLPTLLPHGLLLAGLAAATALRRGPPARLALAWAVLALGVGVGLFHAGRFAYFWMTLGLFPALALALSLDAVASVARRLPARAPALAGAGLAALLAVPAAFESAALLRDTQAVQRESLALVHRNFARDDAGFHPESGLFCQADPKPFPTYYSQLIYRDFAGAERERNADRLIGEFRARPVKFLVHSWRLNQFPGEVRRFWAENYQPYRASVFVAGRRLAGAAGHRERFELPVAGVYRWLPVDGRTRILVDRRPVAAGERIELAAGSHVAVLGGELHDGMLVLALDDAPGPAPHPFYKSY